MAKRKRKNPPKGVSVTHKWKRWMAVGCSHGIHQDDAAVEEMLRFKNHYDPHFSVHLGDFLDTTAFRSGAHGSVDEGTSVPDDCKKGLDLLERYEPNLIMMGNHEDRLYKLLDHPGALVSFAAEQVIGQIDAMAKYLKAEIVEYGCLADTKSWRKVGDTLFGHGWMFNENATRDHVEMTGHNVVIAHIHKVNHQQGRIIGNKSGVCVGTLADIPAMHYAKNRRATASWSQGWAFGEYSEETCQKHTHTLPSQSEKFVPPQAI